MVWTTPGATQRRHHGAPSIAPIHSGDRHAEGADGRGRVEHPRPRARRLGLYRRQPLAQPRGVLSGAAAIVAFLRRKWARELDYRLIKELWAFPDNRIAVRFQYEWRDDSGNWFRAHGNEQWEFDAEGLMRRREASINDVPIHETDRKFHWPLGLGLPIIPD